VTVDRLPKSIREALAKLEPKVRKAFLDAIGDIRKAADPAAIARMIERGDIEAAIRAMRFEPGLFGPLDRALEEAYRSGAIAALAELPRIRDPYDGGQVVIGFNGRHPRAEVWAKEIAGGLITEIVEGQRETARGIIQQGIVAGVNPKATALELVGRINKRTGQREGGIIGLTGRIDPATGKWTGQVGWSNDARAQLEAGDYSAYRSRKLRNKAMDRIIAKAERTGKPLTTAEIDKIIGAYRNNILRYRGEVIARTESITALRAGAHEGFLQLVDSGAVRDDQIVRRWRATGDDRTRHTHMAMNDTTLRGMKTPWLVGGSSLMMYPGDTSLGAAIETTVSCRCYQEFRINYDL
jgi:hypothetical protein